MQVSDFSWSLFPPKFFPASLLLSFFLVGVMHFSFSFSFTFCDDVLLMTHDSHMTCKKCKYEFCWVCMGPWSEHGTQWYSCNRYDEKGGVDARDSQSKSRASLERYLHVSTWSCFTLVCLRWCTLLTMTNSTTTAGPTTSNLRSWLWIYSQRQRRRWRICRLLAH